MKKLYSYVFHGISLCLFSVFAITNPTVVNGQPAYNLETDHISTADLGELLERMGKEIQQKGQVTIGGNTYPVTGFGSIELSVAPRRRQGTQETQETSINFQLSAGREGLPEGTTYISYDRGDMRMTPTEFAEIVAKLGNTLDSKGAFVLDDHSVTLEGRAKIVQKLTKTTQQMRRGSSYEYKFDVMFGQNDFPMPKDEADDITSMRPEERELKGIKELAKKEITGADQKSVAKLLASLNRDLKAGRVRVGDQDLPAGENVECGFSHLIARDGKSHRIQLAFQFGQGPPRRRPTGSKYSEEFINEPIKKVGALLKRLGTEVLEAGTIKLEENVFSVGEKATYEVSATERGFSIELKYTEPPKEKEK